LDLQTLKGQDFALSKFFLENFAVFAKFSNDCETEKGYCEDPDFTGKIEVLEVKKDNENPNVHLLKIKFIEDKEDSRFD